MDNLIWLGQFLLQWVKENPFSTVGFVAVYAMARWLLNRKSALTIESERVIAQLQEESKGKYDSLRPLR
jgi:polysaccharide pyruvyl transferase WcaK-like protein